LTVVAAGAFLLLETATTTGGKVNIRRLAIVVAATVALDGSLGLATTSSAHAQTPGFEVCGNAGLGYCLNDWNNAGGGGSVKMYYGGYSNDDFYYTPEFICNGSDLVQVYPGGGCPFTPGTGLNSAYVNDEIVEVTYGNNTNLCVATNGSAHAVMGNCEETGDAADGVIMVLGQLNCNGNSLVDRYWSDRDTTSVYLQSGGNPGVQATFSITGSPTCWA
jgi:hypothetical protein